MQMNLNDPEQIKITREYVANRLKDITDIRFKLTQDDFGGIENLAHKMKGSGGLYGFDDLTKIGAAMEEAAKIKDKMVIMTGCDSAFGILSRAQEELSR